MGLYLSDPYSNINKQRMSDEHKRANVASYDMPGYSEMQDLYKGSLGGESPDYMDKFAGMIGKPTDFIGGIPGMAGGGEGGYGPIGADQLAEFGEGAYELFDKYKPGMEYIAEEQGVGEQELANMLGTASTEFAGNVASQEEQQKRQMGRMGIDPTSGAWSAGAGERGIETAKGLSGLQQGVRSGAREQDWKERMDAAGIGLNVAAQGTDALGRATGAYTDALSAYGGMYGDYIGGLGTMGGLTEGARQYDKGYSADLAQGLTGARPAYDQTMYGDYSQKQTLFSGSPPGFQASYSPAHAGADTGRAEWYG